ncbi:hypothetical protein PVNG_03860 [Plasmodium vivax North Korean]|uniref:Uncharacterized protein n=1 Tax=Plasmodium vivax North Korean TaxID=1035514 RepID=A0A0J9TUJ4_PLAVI|nr:hypothetical protein PVNG_03860 [Plasmodium vivax North Korean]
MEHNIILKLKYIFLYYLIFFYYHFEGLFSKNKSIFDSRFNNLNGNGKYDKVCITLKGEYAEQEASFQENCKKSMDYLKYLDENYDGNIDAAKGSIYLYCWLYDEELHKQNYNNNGINIYKKFLEGYQEIDFESNIPFIFGNHLKNNIDENLKNIYDLYYKFDKFINQQNCGDSYCKCAEECAGFYNKYMSEQCGIFYKNNFCNELQNFAKMYNAFFTKNNKCDGKEMKLLLTADSYIKVILTPILIIAIVSFIIFFLFKVTNKFNLNK